MEIIRSGEKKQILKMLESQYGISNLNFLLLRFGREKIRAFSGSLSSQEINELDKNMRIETAGIYLGKQDEREIRLALDFLYLVDEAKSNLIEVNDEQAEKWFRGEDISLDKEETKEFKIIKNNGDIIGCGKSTGKEIKNYLPKERRVRN